MALSLMIIFFLNTSTLLKQLGVQALWLHRRCWLGSLPFTEVRHKLRIVYVQPSIYSMATPLEMILFSISEISQRVLKGY